MTPPVLPHLSPIRARGSARIVRSPSAANAAVALPDADRNGVAEWLSSRNAETVRALGTWQAPVLSDAVVETLATIFLMQPGRRVMPFFAWLDDRLRR